MVNKCSKNGPRVWSPGCFKNAWNMVPENIVLAMIHKCFRNDQNMFPGFDHFWNILWSSKRQSFRDQLLSIFEAHRGPDPGTIFWTFFEHLLSICLGESTNRPENRFSHFFDHPLEPPQKHFVDNCCAVPVGGRLHWKGSSQTSQNMRTQNGHAVQNGTGLFLAYTCLRVGVGPPHRKICSKKLQQNSPTFERTPSPRPCLLAGNVR